MKPLSSVSQAYAYPDQGSVSASSAPPNKSIPVYPQFNSAINSPFSQTDTLLFSGSFSRRKRKRFFQRLGMFAIALFIGNQIPACRTMQNNAATSVGNIIPDPLKDLFNTGKEELIQHFQNLTSDEKKETLQEYVELVKKYGNKAQDFIREDEDLQAVQALIQKVIEEGGRIIDLDNLPPEAPPSTGDGSIAFNDSFDFDWNVDPEKLKLIQEVARNNNLDPDGVAMVMASESGFSPGAVNGSTGACGLVQIMPAEAKNYGVSSCNEIANMSFEQQMPLVERFFKTRMENWGRATDMVSTYMLVFSPARVKLYEEMGLDTPIYSKDPNVMNHPVLQRIKSENPDDPRIASLYWPDGYWSNHPIDSKYGDNDGTISARDLLQYMLAKLKQHTK